MEELVGVGEFWRPNGRGLKDQGIRGLAEAKSTEKRVEKVRWSKDSHYSEMLSA